jgi:hypothetical protein
MPESRPARSFFGGIIRLKGELGMSSWHSYPKIYNLGHPAVAQLLDDPVLVEEKIDGSQFSFGMFDGELKVRSKGQQIVPDAPDALFREAVAMVKSRMGLLVNGWTYRAEYLQKPKHNALAYDRIPKNHLIIFDICTAEETYLPYEQKVLESEAIGLECVPKMHFGTLSSAEDVLAFLERTSCLGGQKIEGVVVKNYKKFGPDNKVLLGKYVSEAFKEVHKATWGESNPGKNDMLGFLGHKYRSYARWNKAIQHLKEAGQLTDSPKDIGPLLKEVQNDIEAECSQEIAEVLIKWALPHIKRSAIKGLPEWYKQKLLEKQFEGEKNESISR